MIDSTISTEFAANLGQIVAETYKLIDEEPDLAALSLTELRGKLDSEGLPIDVVIEQLSGLSESNENFLDTFLIQVRPLLDEPNGLQVLTNSIDDQSQEISEKIHQLLDESVQSSLSIDKVGGGSGNLKHPWLAVGLTATGVGGTVALMYHRKVSHLNNLLEHAESKGVERAESGSKKVAKDFYSDQIHLSKELRNPNFRPRMAADRTEVVIGKEAKKYTYKEMEKLFEPFSKGAKARFDEALKGLEPEEIKLVKIKMVEKLVRNDCKVNAEKLGLIGFKGKTEKEIKMNKRIFVDQEKAKVLEGLLRDPVRLEKYMNRKLLEPFQEAFVDAVKNEGNVILEGTKKRLNDDINEALEELGKKAEVEEYRRIVGLGEDLGIDLADDLESVTVDTRDAIDRIEIDLI
jgi:hypothetical protein